jgi:hypothetical protein
MRRLIAGMKISLDGKTEGPEGMADWVGAWSEDYGLTPKSTRLLGAGVSRLRGVLVGIQSEPDKPAWMPATRRRRRARLGSLRRADPALRALSLPDLGSLATDEFPEAARRRRGSQGEARQGHLSSGVGEYAELISGLVDELVSSSI